MFFETLQITPDLIICGRWSIPLREVLLLISYLTPGQSGDDLWSSEKATEKNSFSVKNCTN